jgi:transcriptional regulator with XRE-family HTH domain
MNTLQAIGAEILKARKQQKLTQAALAAELGISRASLSALESGKVPVN